MSIPPLPDGMEDGAPARAANALHSLSIHLLRRARAADRETGLSPERLSLLSVLAYAGPRTVGALAALEGVSPPAISRTLTALEKLGLAARERGGADARQVRARATAKGRRLMEKGRRRRIEIIAAHLSRLDGRELAQLGRVGEILRRLEEEGASSAGAGR